MCPLCVHPVSALHLFAILNFEHYPIFHSRYLCYPKIKKEISMKLFGLDVDGNEKEFDLKNFTGQKVILYFYPKDNTSGCTQEACDFRDNLNRLNKYGTVIGVSPNDIKSHKKFKEGQNLNFILLSDIEHKLAESFNVWKEKSMYGRKYMGIERSTFVLDENGNIEKEWRKVKVKGHVCEVIEYLTSK